MEQFSLEKWLQDNSRKVVTRDGREVRIVFTEAQDDNYPILALVQRKTETQKEQPHLFSTHGVYEVGRESCLDLFFADEEEKPQSIEELLSIIALQEIEYWRTHDKIIRQDFSERAKQILDLARKEILKDLPKWKKIPRNTSRKELFDMMHKHIVLAFNDCVDYYYIDESDLRKLPKEE